MCLRVASAKPCGYKTCESDKFFKLPLDLTLGQVIKGSCSFQGVSFSQ